jgi:hypothetical protein
VSKRGFYLQSTLYKPGFDFMFAYLRYQPQTGRMELFWTHIRDSGFETLHRNKVHTFSNDSQSRQFQNQIQAASAILSALVFVARLLCVTKSSCHHCSVPVCIFVTAAALPSSASCCSWEFAPAFSFPPHQYLQHSFL